MGLVLQLVETRAGSKAHCRDVLELIPDALTVDSDVILFGPLA